ERPEQDNDVRPPQRTDSPHLGAVLAWFKRPPRGLPGYVAIPELAVRSSTRGEFKRVRTPLRGGGSGWLGPVVAPPAVQGDPGSAGATPALDLPREVNAQRLQRRAALLSVLERGGPQPRGGWTHGELRDQAVVLTGASGGTSRAFSLEGEP